MKSYNMEIQDIYKNFNSSKMGLSNKEATKRLKINGLNRLPKSNKATILKVFFNQFNNPITIILLVTIIFSVVIHEYVDAIFICLVIFLDAFLGTVQEWKAEKSAESLQKMIKVNSLVLRDNRKIDINGEYLVPGDIVIIEPGDKISADLRIIESHNLTIDESFLTGESLPALKTTAILPEKTKVADRNNMAFAGAKVMSGRGIGIVVATGSNTEIGKIADEVVSTHNSKTPLTIRMEKFTKQISIITAVMALIITFVLYMKGYATKEVFLSVVALSVSAIPEGLPVVLTVTLSIATKNMVKKNVIVRKLNAVEGLGSCTVIASDKTGTLTLNEQTAKIIELPDGSVFNITGEGYNGIGKLLPSNEKANHSVNNLSHLSKLISMNNESTLIKEKNEWINNGDAIDVAMRALSYKIDGYKEINYDLLGAIPYESENKYSAVFYRDKDGIRVTAKGSPEVIFNFCDMMLVNGKEKKINIKELEEKNNRLASLGYRVIAIADGLKVDFVNKNNYSIHDIPKLTLVALIAFIDPIRVEAKDALKKCSKAGIKVVMITGDHPLTATAIAKELEMIKSINEVKSGDEIDEAFNKGYEYFDEFVKNTKIFARVTPQEKLEIVKSFKRQGEFVAVTGDGINDAPAMKNANISIAMGSGTDVTKETGSLIITDDNFLSIVSGVEEGRNAYNNIRKVIYFLLSSGVAEVLCFILAIIFGLPIPFLAVQLLWLNLVTDGIQDIALAFEKGEKDVMNSAPRKTNESIFDKMLIQETLLAGSVTGILVFVFWFYLINISGYSADFGRNYILLLMVFLQNLHAFNCRSEYNSAFKVPIKNNYFIFIAVAFVILLQIFASENALLASALKVQPFTFKYVIYALISALPLLFVMEIFKIFKRRKHNE